MKYVYRTALALGLGAAVVASGANQLTRADAAPAAPAAPKKSEKSAADSPAASAAQARAQELIDAGLAFLKSKQNEDGSWHGPKEPPGISALVLRAFAQEPSYGASADFVAKGYENLLAHQAEDGGIYKDFLANYNTAIAVSALAAADKEEFRQPIDRAVAFLKGLQYDENSKHPKTGEAVGPDHAYFGGTGYDTGGRPDGSNTQMFIEALSDAGLDKDDPPSSAPWPSSPAPRTTPRPTTRSGPATTAASSTPPPTAASPTPASTKAPTAAACSAATA